MNAKDLRFDELYGIGDCDLFLAKAKEKCEQKLRGRKFAGMEKDDVIQEVLIKVHKSLEKYDSSKAKLSTYIDHVIENMIKDCFKKCGTEKNLTLVNAIELEEIYSWNDEDSEKVSGLHLGTTDAGYLMVDLSIDISVNLDLTDREREIFNLRTQGYEFVEIAQMLGVSKARISQIWSGILSKLENY
jgi:RNA polymerase sporulation-specific sigma factor